MGIAVVRPVWSSGNALTGKQKDLGSIPLRLSLLIKKKKKKKKEEEKKTHLWFVDTVVWLCPSQ